MRRYENKSLIVLLSPAIRKWCYLKVRKNEEGKGIENGIILK